MVFVLLQMTALYSLIDLAALVSYQDLVALNVSCAPKDTCQVSKSNRMMDPVDWKDRNCFCDDLCALYADCCVDAKRNDPEKTASFDCVVLRHFGGIYMKTKCPSNWNDREIEIRCREGSFEDPLGSLPVTDLSSGITYKNAFCAACQRSPGQLMFWSSRIECPYNMSNFSKLELLQNLKFNADKNSWGVHSQVDEIDFFEVCSIDPVVPPAVELHIRACLKRIDQCAASNHDLQSACSSYTAYIYYHMNAYRNVHCAMCNNIPLHDLTCAYTAFLRSSPLSDFDPNAFSLILDVSDSSGSLLVGKTNECYKDQFYDPFLKKCRQIFCSDDKPILANDVCVELDGLANKSATVDFKNCPKFRYYPKEFILLPNRSVFILDRNELLNTSEFLLENPSYLNTSSLLVCAKNVQHPDKFDKLMGYVSAVGIFISCFCLVLHLCAFSFLPELRNFSGRCLASLSFSLLLAYVLFLTGQFRSIQSSRHSCAAVGAGMYFFFMAAFLWMNSLAFDIWKTLKIAVSELRVAKDQPCRKFSIFSVYCWGVAGFFLFIVLLVDQGVGSLPESLRPAFGLYTCWFSHRYALLLYFAAPLVIVMGTNVAFFLFSLQFIQEPSSEECCKVQEIRSHGVIYARLAILLGLTWICGIVASYLDPQIVHNSFLFHIFWYTFILLNALQGLFIFIFFTCTQRTRRALYKRLHPFPLTPKKGKPPWRNENKKVLPSANQDLTFTQTYM